MNFAASETAPFGARYLEDPTMFPLGFDGESWGTRELSLGVLDKRFLVCGLSAAQELLEHVHGGDETFGKQPPQAVNVRVTNHNS